MIEIVDGDGRADMIWRLPVESTSLYTPYTYPMANRHSISQVIDISRNLTSVSSIRCHFMTGQLNWAYTR